jgi:DNA-binding response OmpR family regulator
MSAASGAPRLPIVVHIDDEPQLLELTRLALQSLDVRFLGFARATAGLETVRFARPDLVLLDIMMPELDGWELLARMRAEPALAATKVVIYSALSSEANIARAMKSGADDYLAKPCTPGQLRDIIMRLTGAQPASRGAAGTAPLGTLPPPPQPPGARPATVEPGAAPAARSLPTTDLLNLPAIVVEFVDRYLDTTVALELLSFLYGNPEQFVDAASLGRALGRPALELDAPLRALVGHGLLHATEALDPPLYQFARHGALARQADAFFSACSDPQVRVKALYRVIRRRQQFR